MDDDFRARLLDEAQTNAVVKEFLGIEMTCDFVVVEDTPDMHNVVCCTLCSCYPTQVLGRPPLWYKESSYRSRIVREPRSVLREFGTELPEKQRVCIVDSTSECRYMVLPMRPKNTENKTEQELAQLITRDALIGVRLLE